MHFDLLKAFRLHRKSHQIRFFWKRPILHHTYATCSELLYVQEVVTLQKKYSNIFASENEVYAIH